eukprot:IDg17261t1
MNASRMQVPYTRARAAATPHTGACGNARSRPVSGAARPGRLSRSAAPRAEFVSCLMCADKASAARGERYESARYLRPLKAIAMGLTAREGYTCQEGRLLSLARSLSFSLSLRCSYSVRSSTPIYPMQERSP